MVFRLKLRRFNKWTAGSVLRGNKWNHRTAEVRRKGEIFYFILFYSIILYIGRKRWALVRMRNGSAGFVDPDGGDPPVYSAPGIGR